MTAPTANALSLSRPYSNWTAWGQWLALVTMTVDHVVRYLLPESWDAGWASSSIGRIAMPLFTAMVAWHGLFNTRNPLRYARRILVIGLVAQLPYLTMPRDGFQLNICFTLAAGLTAGVGLRALAQQLLAATALTARHWMAIATLGLAWWVLGDWVEYGHQGLLMIPLYMLAFEMLSQPAAPRLAGLAAGAAALPVLLNAGLLNSSDMAKSFTVATTLLMLLLAAGAARLVPAIPQTLAMPRRLWLTWYPGHFAAMALWLWLVGGLVGGLA